MHVEKCPICESVMDIGQTMNISDLMDKQAVIVQFYFCTKCLLTRSKVIGKATAKVVLRK